MKYKSIYVCYKFDGKLDDFVGTYPFRFDLMNVAASTPEKIIEYLNEKHGHEVDREYYNNQSSLKVEFEREILGDVFRTVYVITPIFILDEIAELA